MPGMFKHVSLSITEPAALNLAQVFNIVKSLVLFIQSYKQIAC